MASKGLRQVVIYPTEEEVAVELATHIAYLSDKIISEKGSFSVALSDGTLIHTLRKLFESPLKETLDWSKWLIFWVDKRVAPLDIPENNNFLEIEGLLSKVPIHKKNIYPIHYTPSPEKVAKDYEGQLRKLVQKKVLPLSATGFPQFDLMLLGIGPEGRVASLFPDRPQRYNTTDWVTYMDDSPEPPAKRVTFTFPVINSANYISIAVTDKAEAKAVAIALKHIPVRPPLPCSEVQAQVLLTWFLNFDAASKLPPNYDFNKKK